MATTTLVSLEEYLATSYRPDMEYIDGELRPKGGKDAVVQWVHSRLQIIIGSWFQQHRKEWRITAGVEARTQVRSTRVRLPDIVVDHAGPHPQVLINPPLIVIEILSPTDTLSEILKRFEDYLAMGVPNIWLVNPDERTGSVYGGGGLLQPVNPFTVAGTAIYLDLTTVFAEYDEDNA